jgi:hypothetical protein
MRHGRIPPGGHRPWPGVTDDVAHDMLKAAKKAVQLRRVSVAHEWATVAHAVMVPVCGREARRGREVGRWGSADLCWRGAPN